MRPEDCTMNPRCLGCGCQCEGVFCESCTRKQAIAAMRRFTDSLCAAISRSEDDADVAVLMSVEDARPIRDALLQLLEDEP